MVHGAGGTLLQHLKELVLHTDVRSRRPSVLLHHLRVDDVELAGERAWRSAPPWSSSTAPRSRRPTILWDMAAAERVTVFGTSAKYLALAEKEGLAPARTHDLSALRADPLHRKPARRPQLRLRVHGHQARTSTSRASAAAPTSSRASRWAIPIGPGLARGASDARARHGGRGVRRVEAAPPASRKASSCAPARSPACPSRSGTIPDGSRYRAAYFDVYPGVWRHGDWARLTEHDGLVILGRSDATLNPGGVRIGTAEIYRQVEQLPEVVESLVDRAGLGGRRPDRAVRAAARGNHPGRGPARPHPRAGSASTPALTTCRARFCRSRTFHGPSAARSPSWPFGTWCTAVRSRTWMRWRTQPPWTCSATSRPFRRPDLQPPNYVIYDLVAAGNEGYLGAFGFKLGMQARS